MADVISIDDIKRKAWSEQGIIEHLTSACDVFLFSYSPTLDNLLSWSGNAHIVLGLSNNEVSTHGNLFMRHVHPDDKFMLMSQLEKAFEGSGLLSFSYRWQRPDKNRTTTLFCRGALNKNAYNKKYGPSFDGLIIDISE